MNYCRCRRLLVSLSVSIAELSRNVLRQ